MQLDSRHAKAPGLRPRIFASTQTTDARWLPIHLSALSSTHRWRDPARQRRRSEEHTSDSSHRTISYAVFCLKKKKEKQMIRVDADVDHVMRCRSSVRIH